MDHASNSSAPGESSVAATESKTNDASRTKVSLSLSKKKKTKTTSGPTPNFNSSSGNVLGEEYGTIAEEAEAISKRRKEEGTLLVIPCRQGKDENEGRSSQEERKQPLLAARLALLRRGDAPISDQKGNKASENSPVKENEGSGKAAAIKDEIDAGKIKDDSNELDDNDDAAVQQLIQSAQHNVDGKNPDDDSNAGGGDSNKLVIGAPSKNSLITRNKSSTAKDDIQLESDVAIDEEEQFRQELSHHAADVDPTSHVYATVSISDFGSALLRGMGWTGGASSNSGNAIGASSNQDEVKPRPHRLGLGAAPLPPPSSSARGGGGEPSKGGGIHRRIRRPEELRRDEERERAEAEREKKAKEKKLLDRQFTLQPGSVVQVRESEVQDSSYSNRGSDRYRAVVVQTNGVPGLNRILIRLEGSSKAISVAKGGVVLCTWEELDSDPFRASVMKSQQPNERQRRKEDSNYDQKRKRSRSYSSDDGQREKRRGRIDDRRIDRGREKEHSRSRNRSRDRSYDSERSAGSNKGSRRSDSRDYRRDRSRDNSISDHSDGRKRRKDSSRHRKRDRSRDRSNDRERSHKKRDRSRDRSNGRDRKRDSSRKHRDGRKDSYRSRSPDHHSKNDTKRSKTQHSQRSNHQHLDWLLPNIRVRLVSKKIPRQYLQKGIVQDVLKPQQNQSKNGHASTKAVLLMQDGQVLDNIPERYLETALPKTGGKIIVLEGLHRWKKGQLLERSSEDGCGVVQLQEDLEVVKVSLDSIAEWCGPLDDDYE